MKNASYSSKNLIHDSGKKHVSGFAEYTDDITEPLNTLIWCNRME
jgi:xanthine dehydrogenase molybdopterin-binding subunit B